MNIAYVTDFDLKNINKNKLPRNQLGHIGRCTYIAKSLENQSLILNYLGPLTKKDYLLPKLKRRIYRDFKNKVYYDWAEPMFNKDYAAQILRKLSSCKSDIVLSPDINLISYLDYHKPIVLWVDTLYAGLIDFYQDYMNLCKETIGHLTTLDELTLNRCTLAIFSSEWAAKPAIETYKIDPAKVKIIPSGANVECNRSIEDIKTILEARPSDTCKLLFLGVDWFRKGGDIVLKVAKQLKEDGMNVELTVVGCQPVTQEPLPDFVVNLGFISKSKPEGLNKINRLIAESHFLMMPSQAETYGNVFCEANSFGVPCLATDVGGIPTIIKDNLNGKVFSKEASINEYCHYISTVFSNYSQYQELAISSFNEYQTRLNWSVAGKTAKKLFSDLLSS